MPRGDRFRGAVRLTAGFVLVGLGFLLLLDNLGWVDASGILPLWPLLFVLFGITRILQPARRGIGLFFILFGFWLYLHNVGFLRLAPWDWWPIVLILLGAGLVWQALSRSSPPARDAGEADALAASAILGGARHRVGSKEFRGGEATAILGGCVIDLRDAIPVPGGAVLDALALWGGVEILVPSDWKVDLRGRPVLGGFTDTRVRTAAAPRHSLIVKGSAIMGGVEVKD